MPTKDPVLWAAFMVWLHDNWPSIYGFFLAVGIAWLRITHLGGKGQRRVIEASLCGLLTIAFSNGMEFFFGIPRELSGFVGGWIGWYGVDRLREWSLAKLKQDMKEKAE